MDRSFFVLNFLDRILEDKACRELEQRVVCFIPRSPHVDTLISLLKMPLVSIQNSL